MQKKEVVVTGLEDDDVTGAKKKPEVVVMLSRHPDFEERACDSCHNRSSGNFLQARKERLCFMCHDEDEFKGAFVHGPVAVSACLECHVPHESRYASLLRHGVNELCLSCHQLEDVALNPAHENLSVVNDPGSPATSSVTCVLCHYPHKGDKKYLLKPPEERVLPVEIPQGQWLPVMPWMPSTGESPEVPVGPPPGSGSGGRQQTVGEDARETTTG